MRRLAFAAIAAAVIITISVTTISAQQSYNIPSWFKGVAGFWAEDKISDQEFGEGISFLINEEIIQIPEMESLKQQVEQLEDENLQLKIQLGGFVAPPQVPTPAPEPISSINIELYTLESSYVEGDTIEIFGSVSTIILDTPITIQVFDPDGFLVAIEQVMPDVYGNYSIELKPDILWETLGEYEVEAIYGEGKSAETTFDFTSSPAKTSQYSQQSCLGNARCITGSVTRVIDGDTIEVDYQSVRFSLASTPEPSEYQGPEAKAYIASICPVGSEVLVDEDDGQTEGSYGRIVAVIYCNGMNLNEAILDSGYGYLSSSFCYKSEFEYEPWAQRHGCGVDTSSSYSKPQTSVETAPSCDPSYPDFCIPPPPPDLDCKDIPTKNFTVLQPDPHRFDGDKDGIGCES